MTSRTNQRTQLGAAAILSVSEAVELLPWSDQRSRLWLHDKGLIIRRADAPGPCVVWGHVVEALTEPDPAPVQRLERAGLW